MTTDKEILLIAEQQKEVLERKFPSYKHLIYLIPDCHLRVEHPNGTRLAAPHNIDSARVILVASFSSSSIEIAYNSSKPPWFWSIKVNYADPKFTENTLSDILYDIEGRTR